MHFTDDNMKSTIDFAQKLTAETIQSLTRKKNENHNEMFSFNLSDSGR